MVGRFAAFDSWESIRSIPYYFFYYYVPTRYRKLSSESEYIRDKVWNFKDGLSQQQFIDQLEKKIKHTFGNPNFLTLVCIPASTNASNKARYERFSEVLCKKLNMTNGFQYISILKEKSPSHLGGSDLATYDFDRGFFKGKQVVLFDDVVTRGGSMQSFMDYLEEVGAKVVCCMSIGRTFYDRYMAYEINHPWTGNTVFQCGTSTAPDKDNRTIANETTKPSVVEEAHKATQRMPVADVAKLNQESVAQQPVARHQIGDHVRFGRFNGKPVQWIVLDHKDDEYLVISKFGLECMPFNKADTFTTWDKCSLRQWLNEDFYNRTFNSVEQEKIIRHEVVASDNPIYRSSQGKNTNDKIFILNIKEYNQYFDIYNKWVCKLFSGILRQCWLRNSGNDNSRGAFVGRSGSIHAGGSKVTSSRNAVRPVFWVKL